MSAYTINFNSITKFTDEQFEQLCLNNPEMKFEVSEAGNLVIMSPTGGETGEKNSNLNADFVIWNRQTQLGKVFDSSTCFRLPHGAKRSPDVSWIELSRWNTLTTEEKRKFPPIAPDFVLELMSPTDNLKDIQDKMQEYMNNGVKLGWLINPEQKQVEIYCQGKDKQVLDNPSSLQGEDILPGLVIDLQEII